MKALLVVLACALACACSPASRQMQLNVAEVATQAASELGHAMAVLYSEQVQHCVIESTNSNDYAICKMGVDQAWGHARLAYDALRITQAEYADNLEKNKVTAADFLDWFRIAYCELKAFAPPELILLPVPGLTCGDTQ
jgi:hypothetical protein